MLNYLYDTATILHRHRRRSIATGCAIATLLTAATTPSTDVFESLVAAERNFAADAGRIGITEAFRASVAPDGVLFRPDPIAATAALAAERDEPGITLEWQPAMAAIARSGDFGFTSGPYRMTINGQAAHGQFLTVWQRGADGRWRWLLDQGLPPVAGDLPSPLPRVVQRVANEAAVAPTAPITTEAGSLEVIEDRLNVALVQHGGQALAPMIAPGGRLLRAGKEPIEDGAIVDLLSTETAIDSASRLAMRQSAAGDLAFTYGRIEADKKLSYYVRIWQRGSAGWHVLVDEIVPVRRSS